MLVASRKRDPWQGMTSARHRRGIAPHLARIGAAVWRMSRRISHLFHRRPAGLSRHQARVCGGSWGAIGWKHPLSLPARVSGAGLPFADEGFEVSKTLLKLHRDQ